MILVDTSLWINHFKRTQSDLAVALEKDWVCCHDFILGELACGSLKQRDPILGFLENLPQCATVSHDEAMTFLNDHRLMNTGIGWIEVHLLASTALEDSRLWTADRKLAAVALALSLSYSP